MKKTLIAGVLTALGSVMQKGREGSIEVIGADHHVVSAAVGSRTHSTFVVKKKVDVASSKLYSALLKMDLSEREHQVMTQAHLGHTDKVTAYELGLSSSTVRVLLHRATRKLGAATRHEALARFDALTKERVEETPERYRCRMCA